MSDFYIGQIFLFAGNYAPKDSAFCRGQILPIASNQALFSLLGTSYGGDGVTNFGLPDYRGRVPVGSNVNQSPTGINAIKQGTLAGYERISLTAANLPAHKHIASPEVPGYFEATTKPADQGGGGQFNDGEWLGKPSSPNDRTLNFEFFTPSGSAPVTLGGAALSKAQAVVQSTGVTNASLDMMQPSLVVNFCIALDGTYPPRT